MQAVKSLLTQQLAEMKGKTPESNGVSIKQFESLPKTVAQSLAFSLQAEQAGLKPLGSSAHQVSMSCFEIAEQTPPGSFVSTPDGELLTKLDYLQAAANLSPKTTFLWQALADSLSENQTAMVGQQRLSKSDCQARSAPLAPIRVRLGGQPPENQTHTNHGAGPQNLQHSSLEVKQGHNGTC